ncbi:MAG: ABC transporter substrate-binding protein [Candidatus Methanomethylophilaceae archaeon]|nr:ABC transporter substrate-binding protein [Candidatus Methanomethylophilaceae archaeon]
MNRIMLIPIAIIAICMVPILAEDSEAAFTVTDGTGMTFEYAEAEDKIILNGSATALTIADAGAVDKIVAVDMYSTYEYTKFEELKDLRAEDLKSFYGTTNHEYIITTIVKMVESGKFSLDDTIILTSYSSNLELREKLSKEGFTRILVWNTIESYSDLVKMVEDVSLIASGSIPDSITAMKSKIKAVEDKAASFDGTDRPKALYVWYYSKSLQIGNTGIMKSMLDVCKANNIGYDPSNSAARYGDVNAITKLLENNKDAVVFVSNSYFSAGKTLDDFYNEVFSGDRTIKVIPMGLQWNNWCPESADGLTEIANALYASEPTPAPEPAPEPSEDKGLGKYIVYAAAAMSAILLLALIGLYFKLKKNKA